MSDTFEGKTYFGNKLIAARGARGSAILTEIGPKGGFRSTAISADSVKALAAWIQQTQPAAPSAEPAAEMDTMNFTGRSE